MDLVGVNNARIHRAHALVNYFTAVYSIRCLDMEWILKLLEIQTNYGLNYAIHFHRRMIAFLYKIFLDVI